MRLRACLHGGGGLQVGEVTRLAVVEKWLAFACKLTTPGSRGDVTRRCYVVARHVNRENGGRTTHFSGQCSFPLIRDLTQQDGWKTQDGRMTYKNVAQDRECTVSRNIFRHSAVLSLPAVLLRKVPIICCRCNISVPLLFTVTFDEFGALWRACKCNMNSTPARRVTPP